MSGRSCEICEAKVLKIYTAEVYGRTVTRVTVAPTGKGSRRFWRTDSKAQYLTEDGYPTDYENAAPDPRGGKKMHFVPVPPKPVTLIVIDNITVIPKRETPA